MKNILVSIFTFGLILIGFAQSNSVQIINSRSQKLAEIVDKNEFKVRTNLKEAKIAYEKLMVNHKNGTISNKKFDRKKVDIEDAMNKAKNALNLIYEAKGLLK